MRPDFSSFSCFCPFVFQVCVCVCVWAQKHIHIIQRKKHFTLQSHVHNGFLHQQLSVNEPNIQISISISICIRDRIDFTMCVCLYCCWIALCHIRSWKCLELAYFNDDNDSECAWVHLCTKYIEYLSKHF